MRVGGRLEKGKFSNTPTCDEKTEQHRERKREREHAMRKVFRNRLRERGKRVASREFTLGIRLRKILPRHQMHHRGFSEGKPKSTERDIAVQKTTLVD